MAGYIKRIIRDSDVGRFFPVLLAIGLGWGSIQAMLFAEIAAPWIRHDTHNTGMFIRLGSIIAGEILLISALYYCLSKTFRRITGVLIFLLCILTAANLAHLNYFGGLIHLRKLREFYTLFYIRDQLLDQIFDGTMYFLLFASVALGAFLWTAAGRPGLRPPGTISRKLLFLIPALALHIGLYTIQTGRFQVSVTPARFLVGNSTAYFMFGMIPVYGSMFSEISRTANEATFVPPIQSSLNSHLERQPAERLTPDAVFIIQAESLDGSAIFHVSPDGIPLMPFLRDRSEKSVLLQEYYVHHNGAASASAEIAALLSVKPSADHNGLLTIDPINMHPLNTALERLGYESFFLHSNRGSFFGRKSAYAKMQFRHFLDMPYFHGDAAGFKARDSDFFEQSLAMIKERCPVDKKPFAYLVTMQSHGPFNNYRRETSEQLKSEGFYKEQNRDPIYFDYLCSMRELDQALALFWAGITNGPYRHPLVVLHPDHLSGVYDKPVENIEAGTALIWSPQLSARIISVPTSSYDIAPTLMHLLAGEDRWEEADWWIGDTVFTIGPRKVIQVQHVVLEGDGTRTTKRGARPAEQPFIQFCREIQN